MKKDAFFFPKADKLGYLMINRASVQMWGIVGPSAGRPKWAGKKNYCVPAHARVVPFLCTRSDFIYTKNSARPGSDFPYTKNRRGRDPILSTQT